MKKFGIIILLAALAVSLSACGNPSASSSAASATSTAQTATKPAEKDIASVNYKKLYANDGQYRDKYVRIAAKVNHIGDKYITINDGLGGGANQIIVYWEASAPSGFKEGDYVLATGKVGIKALGSLAIENSYFEGSGTNAKAKYDEYEQTSEKATSQSLTDGATSVEYKTLYKDYMDNPIGADKKYRDKKLIISGPVGRIDREIDQSPYVTFDMDESGMTGIRIDFNKGEEDKVGKLKKGQKIKVVGKCSGTLLSTTVVLDDSYLLQ